MLRLFETQMSFVLGQVPPHSDWDEEPPAAERGRWLVTQQKAAFGLSRWNRGSENVLQFSG